MECACCHLVQVLEFLLIHIQLVILVPECPVGGFVLQFLVGELCLQALDLPLQCFGSYLAGALVVAEGLEVCHLAQLLPGQFL